MAPSDYEIIRNAILNRQQVIATHHGRPREMCPHIVGTKNGRFRAFFYQFGGASESGLAPDGSSANWRCIFIDELSDISVREGEWHTAANYDSSKQNCIDQVDRHA